MLAPISMTRPKPQTLDLSEYFHRSRLFSCLSDEQASLLAEQSSVRQVASKTLLTNPGDLKCVQFLLSGRIRVCYLTRDGKQPVLYFVNPGELVGEQSILTGRTADDYVETMEPSVVAQIPTAALRDLMLGESDFAICLAELISRRRVAVEQRLRSLLFLTNRDRLTHLLLDLAEQYGTSENSSENLELKIKLSHQDLANFIGSTRETVTVVLGKMQTDGLINIKRRRIVLLDPQSLAKSVERQFEVS